MKIPLILTLILLLALFIPSSYAENWTVGLGGDQWIGNTSTDPEHPITYVQCTGKVELDIVVNNLDNVSMVSYWRFDNDTIVDENTTSGNDGNNYGADYTTGVYGGGAYNFIRGNNDFMDMGNDDSLNNITGDLIMDVWIEYTTSGFDYDSYILSKNQLGWEDIQYGLYRDNNDRARVYLDGAHRVESDPVLSRGTWYHFVGLRRTIDVSDPRVAEIYIDGVYNVDGSNEYDTELTRTTYNLRIGRRSPSSLYFNGKIDNPRICSLSGIPDDNITDIVAWMHYDTKVPTGNLTSVLRDFGMDSKWLDLSFYADIPGNTSIDLYVNTSTDNSTWTGPQLIKIDAIGDGTLYPIPAAYQDRYGQWTLVLHKDSYDQNQTDYLTPEIENVTLHTYITPIPDLSYTSGETWISWIWNATGNDSQAVYVDGQYVTNSTTDYIIISDLEPNELHTITFINESGVRLESTAYTKKASFQDNFIYLLIIGIVFWLLGQKFQLFTWLSMIIFFYGGITSLSQTAESWIIITFWLAGIIAIFSMTIKEV